MILRKLSLSLSVGAFVVVSTLSGLTAQAGPADVDANDAFWWWGDPAGTSRIVRNDKGISGNISVHLGNDSGSAKGLAITLWLVIFNNPEECATAPCTDADLFNPAVMPDLVNGGGNVVGASEKARIGFHYKAGNNAGSIATLFTAVGLPFPLDNGEGYGLIDPRGAEVHYVIRFHGPKDAAAMPAQIQSYGGGCVDFAPFGYPFPAGSDDLYLLPGQCQDVIFAINTP
ncbi:MAG: hypothetical protein QNK16_12090 [Woeseiaceae bacterium]|nr:hypothetical protein [Woeseiaceae bacterium]MDX2609116.1 hypothetical protein [Woeseiaceae bacterium]